MAARRRLPLVPPKEIDRPAPRQREVLCHVFAANAVLTKRAGSCNVVAAS